MDMTNNKKLLLRVPALAFLALIIVCVFWGKQIFASPAGPAVQGVFHVVDFILCLFLLPFAGLMVYFAFRREDEEKFGFKSMLLCLAIAGFCLHLAINRFHLVDNLHWLFGLLS